MAYFILNVLWEASILINDEEKQPRWQRTRVVVVVADDESELHCNSRVVREIERYSRGILASIRKKIGLCARVCRVSGWRRRVGVSSRCGLVPERATFTLTRRQRQRKYV